MRTFHLGAFLLLLASATAVACPLCTGTDARLGSQHFHDYGHAVLAMPQGKAYRVVEVVKGASPAAVLEEVVVRDPVVAGKPVLLVRDEAWPMWVSLGNIAVQHLGTLRNLAVDHPPATDALLWQRRMEAALPHLGSRDKALADIAHSECTSAPYSALRAAKASMDAKQVRRLLGDRQLASQYRLHLLLLGIAGDARDAANVEGQLDDAWRAHDATNLGSLLAADLELRGAPRVAWIEDRYLRDVSRTPAEVEAALLALSVQGNAGGAIARERVIEAYRVFTATHPDTAGLVANDLAAWKYWDAAPEFAALLKSNVRQQYASRAAIVAYLRQSPLSQEVE